MTRRAILILFLLAALFVLAGTSAAHAQEAVHRAGLVIRFPNGDVQKVCVSFGEASITGEQLLQRSGLTMIIDYNAGLGGAVCSINNQGCAFPVQDCFCQCQGTQCEYWAYYHWIDGAWQYSQVGASSYQVTDGALEGWSWGPGSFGASGTQPPQVAFQDVCAAPATATSTATPTATATATLVPTATPSPTATIPQSQPSPEVSFMADTTDLVAGSCTVLRWVTWGADHVTLDGMSVADQGQSEVCPQATQRYVLVAANSAGQVAQDVLLTVQPSEDEPPLPNLNLTVTVVPTRTATPTRPPTVTPQPSPIPSLPAVTPTVSAAGPQPAVQPQVAQPSPPSPRAPGNKAAAQVQERPTASSADMGAARALALAPTLLAPATSTPRPRRPLGGDGRATPTPILLARIEPTSAVSAPITDLAGSDTPVAGPDRGFHLALLPGYAAYLLIAAVLGAIGAWVVRRNGYR